MLEARRALREQRRKELRNRARNSLEIHEKHMQHHVSFEVQEKYTAAIHCIAQGTYNNKCYKCIGQECASQEYGVSCVHRSLSNEVPTTNIAESRAGSLDIN